MFVVTALLAASCMALSAGAAQAPPPPTTDLYGEPHYELVGKLIYGYQRLLFTMKDKVRADPAREVPPELLAHFARVTAEYDAIMVEHGDVPDTRLDTALQAVQAVAAEMLAWEQKNVPPPATRPAG